MGVIASKQPKVVVSKRRSTQVDFSNLTPLKPGGTVGFSAFRENGGPKKKSKAKTKVNGDAMEDDSEEEDDETEVMGKMEDIDDKDEAKTLLSPDDAKFSGELADGVGRIKVTFHLQLHDYR